MAPPRNDPQASLTRFCLALEEHRRTPEGRVKTAQQFVAHFFTQSETAPQDRIFCHVPKDVRGPVISAWGIRGSKAALRDSDEKVASVVSDALIATDLSPTAFEEGVSAAITVAWVPLTEWWSFWRASVLTKAALGKALVTAYDLVLFDAAWMFEHLESKTHKGTDVVSEALGKEELSAWIKQVHASKDGTDKGLLQALGWEKLIAKTNNDSLVGLLDALAIKVGLTPAPEQPAAKTDPPVPAAVVSETPAVGVAQAALAAMSAPSLPEVDGKHPGAVITKKPSIAPPAAAAEPDMDETGPYAVPSSSKMPNTAVANSAVADIPIVFEEDNNEIDETRRVQRKPAPAHKAGR